MNINTLSMSDLKAALDFVREDLKSLELEAKEKNINPKEIACYDEVKKIEGDLYDALLNITRKLK